MNGILSVYRKELLDTIRDRKTLIFMLLIPTVVTPLLMWGAAKLIIAIQKEQAVKTVTIAASPQTQENYVRMVQRWFGQTEAARALRVANSPLVRALVRDGTAFDELGLTPGVLEDPDEFRAWAGSLRELVRQNLDAPDKRRAGGMADLADEMQDEAVAFYRVLVKGLASVEFVDPAGLEDPPAGFDRYDLPDHLAGIPDIDRLAHAINSKQVEGYLDIPGPLDDYQRENHATLDVLFVHDSTISMSSEAFSRIRYVGNQAREKEVELRLVRLGLRPALLDAVDVADDADLASPSEILLSVFGGILPYMVLAFAFLGGLYPAIDLGAGEKERNTLETLLLTPRSRTELALGKFFVIMTTSLVAALLGLVALGVSANYLIPESLREMLDFRIDPLAGLMAALLVVPPAAAFAGGFLALSIFARSFKEAQNYIAPLQFIFILPAMAPMIPGVEINTKLALIPLVNVSILARDLVRGDIHFGYYMLTLASCGLFAAVCVAFAVQQFRREAVLFRS